MASETFLTAFDRRHSFDPARGEVRPWLYGIASNLAARHVRAETRRYKALAEVGGRPADEQKQWTDSAPSQFMYVEPRELRNPRSLENRRPNGALVPGQAKYRTIQQWHRVDGQVTATVRNGRLVVKKMGEGNESWSRLEWSQITKLTTPEAVRAYVAKPDGPLYVDVDAMAGQYVLPPAVQAAVFRYLAQQPGMKVNADARNLDGRPAIGLGRVVEGYLSQELLFDKQSPVRLPDR